MAKNDEKNTKEVAVKEKKENNSVNVVRETITYDNTPILNKIYICLLVIIALLAVNIIMNAIKATSSSDTTSNKKTTTSTAESTENYDVSNFTAVNADGFVEAFKKDEYTLIYLGRPNCGYCVKFVPNLTEVQNKYNFKTVYLDINTVTTQEEYNKIVELDEEFFTGEDTAYGYTPTTLIVKNGKIVDYQVGYTSTATLEELVSKYFDKK